MIFWGILSILIGIIIFFYTIRLHINWNSGIDTKLRGWIAALTFIIIGIMILYDNL